MASLKPQFRDKEKNFSETAQFSTRKKKSKIEKSNKKCMQKKLSHRKMVAAKISLIKCLKLLVEAGMDLQSRNNSYKN